MIASHSLESSDDSVISVKSKIKGPGVSSFDAMIS